MGRVKISVLFQNKTNQSMRVLLPRLKRKLYLMLVEFREVGGLGCDAEPCINELAHIILSEVELETIRARARKRSTQGKGRPAVRSRRGSENNRMLLNTH
jgi:hypothetical protein